MGETVRAVGFSGTAAGMPAPQRATVRRLLEEARERGIVDFVFGLCVGADEEAAEDARELGFRLVGFPGRPLEDPFRSLLVADVVFPVPLGRSPELRRNRAIVGWVGELVGAPESGVEVLRSGTWATIRYARRASLPVVVVGPDGTFSRGAGSS